MNRADRRWFRHQGRSAPGLLGPYSGTGLTCSMWVTCVRVMPTTGGAWEATFARHRGNDVHDVAVCASERFSLLRLVESEGRCTGCGASGLVLSERGGGVGPLCPPCTTVAAQLVVREAMASEVPGDRRRS